ncbi:MAG: hypothetical protein J0M33_29680 [Anaerolineae bacterium]|nr:hypothetical protein [Anaerolineae bacterium]
MFTAWSSPPPNAPATLLVGRLHSVLAETYIAVLPKLISMEIRVGE